MKGVAFTAISGIPPLVGVVVSPPLAVVDAAVDWIMVSYRLRTSLTRAPPRVEGPVTVSYRAN